jgi:hypothetical protein
MLVGEGTGSGQESTVEGKADEGGSANGEALAIGRNLSSSTFKGVSSGLVFLSQLAHFNNAVSIRGNWGESVHG